MKKESQKTLKTLSKILQIITIIGKVCSIIAIPCIILVMACVPYFVNNINVDEKELSFKVLDQKVVLMEEGKNNTNLNIMVDGNKVSSTEEGQIISIINNALKNVSKNKIIACIEITLLLAIATIIVSIMAMNVAIKLFKNIGEKETPFIDDNVLYLRKMAKLMIIVAVLEILSNLIIQSVVGSNISSSFNTYSVIEILMVFVLAIIFEYGCELQKSSKKKIYTEDSK